MNVFGDDDGYDPFSQGAFSAQHIYDRQFASTGFGVQFSASDNGLESFNHSEFWDIEPSNPSLQQDCSNSSEGFHCPYFTGNDHKDSFIGNGYDQAYIGGFAHEHENTAIHVHEGSKKPGSPSEDFIQYRMPVLSSKQIRLPLYWDNIHMESDPSSNSFFTSPASASQSHHQQVSHPTQESSSSSSLPQSYAFEANFDTELNTSRVSVSERLQFSNYDEAQKVLPSPHWRSPQNDKSLPVHNADRQKYACKLIKAINNTHETYDARGNKSFMKRWHDPISGPTTYYSDVDKEIVAWRILALAEALHRNGAVALRSLDMKLFKAAARTKDWSFGERMDGIVELLESSKARCEKVLLGQVKNVVANPTLLLDVSMGNLKQNSKRQKWLEEGRRVKAKSS